VIIKKVHLVLGLLMLLAIAGCKNDIELNAPYKEYPSIYAVLNPNENVQTIRINKVFLGEGDANVMAKVADSVNYDEGDLSVMVTGAKINTTTGAITSSKTFYFGEQMVQTAPGAFATAQRVYTCATSNFDFTLNSYTLTVNNLKTGNVFTAKSKSLSPIKISGFTPLCAPPYPVSATNANKDNPDVFVSFYSLTVPKTPYNIRFYPNEAVVYQPVLRFHFYDSLPGTKIDRYIDYPFGNLDIYKDKPSTSAGLKGTIGSQFYQEDVFSALGVAIKKLGIDNQVLGRRFVKLEAIVYSSTQDYFDYLEFAKPSFNISQNKPLYSNFDKEAAIGIFTMRTTFSIEKEIAAPYINALATHPNLCYYKFFLYGTTTPANCQ
jgi:hypothetical protein